MKKQQTQILLFLLVFLGVLILATSAYSGVIEPPGGNRDCIGDAPGTCLEIKNNLGQTVYIVKLAVLNPDGETVSIADPGTTWPHYEGTGANRVAVFWYWAGPSQGTVDGTVNKPSAWSYSVSDLDGEPIDAIPPGAQLPLGSFTCGDNSIAFDRIAYKQNQSVNFKNDAIFAFYGTDKAIADPCNTGNFYVLYGKECNGGPLTMPQLEGFPFVEERRFQLSGYPSVLVNYDQCTGVPLDEVICETSPGVPYDDPVEYDKDASGAAIPPWFYADMPGYPAPNPSKPYEAPAGVEYRLFQVLNMGPEAGTAVFTGNGPIYFWGPRQYWCPAPPVQ